MAGLARWGGWQAARLRLGGMPCRQTLPDALWAGIRVRGTRKNGQLNLAVLIPSPPPQCTPVHLHVLGRFRACAQGASCGAARSARCARQQGLRGNGLAGLRSRRGCRAAAVGFAEAGGIGCAAEAPGERPGSASRVQQRRHGHEGCFQRPHVDDTADADKPCCCAINQHEGSMQVLHGRTGTLCSVTVPRCRPACMQSLVSSAADLTLITVCKADCAVMGFGATAVATRQHDAGGVASQHNIPVFIAV